MKPHRLTRYLMTTITLSLVSALGLLIIMGPTWIARHFAIALGMGAFCASMWLRITETNT